MKPSHPACCLFAFSLALALAAAGGAETMHWEWSSSCLTSPAPPPEPLRLTLVEVRARRPEGDYSLAEGSLTLRKGRRGELTLSPRDRSFALRLEVREYPAGPRAFASSVGGTEWRHDHAACGPGNAIDGNPDTAWRAGQFHLRDAWLAVRFPAPVELDEIELVEAPPYGVRKWRLLGQRSARELPRVLAEGEELGAHRRIPVEGVWHNLHLALIENEHPPAVAELIPRHKGRPLTAAGPADRLEINALFSDGVGQAELVAETDIEDPILGRTVGEKSGDGAILALTSGYATSPSLRSLFDRRRDLALTFEAWQNALELAATERGYQVRSRAPSGQRLLGVQVRRYYFQSELGVRFYRPIDKSQWPVAPTFGMTWYGIRAWADQPSQTHARLDPQIEWVARHLKPYGLSVFQLDDCYDRRDDALMRSLSDKIRAEGMIPGIWFVPFSTAFAEQFMRHPDWFLHDEKGARIKTFTGHTYRDPELPWEGPALNLSARGAEEWYRAWWKKLNDQWNFDYFKIDGIPTTVDAYYKAADLDRTRFTDPMLGIQRGIEIGREVVGATKFINLCWGMPVDAMGFANGSRTGQDSGGFKHNIRTVIEWQYLNNTAWWCDPDSLSYMHDKTVEHTRLRAQARTLTGQQFSTDETWTLFPDPITRVLQKSIPMIDIRPALLYRITPDWEKYEAFDLKIARPWGQWDVVGLFNYRDEPRRQALELGRLDLPAGRYHVWSFWEHRYVGEFDSRERVELPAAKPLEGRAYALRSAGPGPRLLATDRHTTMGGLDLIEYACAPEGEAWRLSGLSDHLVEEDPYRITLWAPGLAVSEARSDNGGMTVEYLPESPGVVDLVVWPERSGAARWSARLEPGEVRLVRAEPGRFQLGMVSLAEPISATLELHASASDPTSPIRSLSAEQDWITLHAPGPYRPGEPYRIPFTIQSDRLAPNTDYAGALVMELQPNYPQQRLEVAVEFRTGGRIPGGARFDELSRVHDELLISHQQGYGQIQKDRSITGAPIVLGGRTYATGLGSHAEQKTSYFIGGRNYRAFSAVVGLDETARTGRGKAAVRFRVEVDGVERWRTPEMREDSPPITIVVDGLENARVLSLFCDPLGGQDYDHADWGQARLYR